MNKIFFFFAMLASVVASAQSGVTVTPVSAKNNAVTFNVSWLNSSRTGTYNSKVWVWVDYREVIDNAPSGSWTRALVSGTPTATAGTPSRETGNDKGFWLQGTSGSSGTYNATVTVQLSNVPVQFNWCAYVSDCPPTIKFSTQRDLTLTGTIPFIITYTDNSTVTVNATSFTLASGQTFKTVTDATFCPTYVNNTINGIIPTVGTDKGSTTISCNGSTLYVQSATNGSSPWLPNNYCPVGWRWPNNTELCCITSAGMFRTLLNKWWSSNEYNASNGVSGGYTCQSGYSNVSDCCAAATGCCGYAGFRSGTFYVARMQNPSSKSTLVNVLCVKN
ncbi:MAG: hypothetical protein LBU42_07315 [Prevotellaceae bacterium]|jgi:hypothetical protein|nr:hypothetical protein [Prevotellaceae bacterium]